MIYDTHVFLGPTLEHATAQHHLPHAHYHPPVQCGDLIRLLRLHPQYIIIIDGLYEQVPAVWHKEIMLALDRGIEVYGAASMGALRAAELHHYGMIGVGTIFQAFASNQLTDDDEVAVLHHGREYSYLPLNDAMVNIRKTLAIAVEQKIISLNLKEELIKWCKAQFYPNRSLLSALNVMDAPWYDECALMREWLLNHGVYDLKREDAISVLEYAKHNREKKRIQAGSITVPYTKFIASLVDDVIATPFHQPLPWFPEMEQKLHLLSVQKTDDYRIILELTGLIRNAMASLDSEELLERKDVYLHYIETHHLYYPKQLHQFFEEHATYSSLSLWLLHYICLAHIKEEQIKKCIPIASFYFTYPHELDYQTQFLSWIVLFIFLLYQHINDECLVIKKSILEHHLEEIHFWQRFKQQAKNNSGLNTKNTLEFIVTYMKVIYVYHGVKDFKLGLAATPDYFQWVYDVMALYEQAQELIHEF